MIIDTKFGSYYGILSASMHIHCQFFLLFFNFFFLFQGSFLNYLLIGINVKSFRNAKFFGDQRYVSIDLKDDIIETIMYRGWSSKKLRKHIANLMC